MLPAELDELVGELGQPAYRTQQILDWLYVKGVSEVGQMSNLSKSLRILLAERTRITSLSQVERRESATGEAVKFLFELPTGQRVESVLIVDGDRRTVCLSWQVGCPLDCKFCATGRMGLIANLTAGEIIDQLLQVSLYARERGERVTNVVMMGMGEPLLNFDPVLESVEIMRNQIAYCLSRKRITISTSGIVPQINKLADLTDVSLAISLHAAENELRDIIVPINKKYPIKDLLNSCNNYLSKQTGKRNITIEYILIDGINDSLKHAASLSKILANLSCKINLIPFNPFEGSEYKRSTNKSIYAFKNYMANKGYITTCRITRGDAIDGACGQLVGNLKKTIKGKSIIQHTSIQ